MISGINHAALFLAYDSSNLIFADLMKQSSGFGLGFADNLGWPYSVPRGSSNPPSMIMAANARLPAGTYPISGNGVGQLEIQGTFKTSAGSNNRLQVVFDGVNPPVITDSSGLVTSLILDQATTVGQITVVVVYSLAGNPLRDVVLKLPGHENKEFYDQAVADISLFKVSRFMDWASTNGSTQVKWSDNTLYSFSFPSCARVDWATIARFSNATNNDCHINIPHNANDDYVVNMARTIDTVLSPGLAIHIEFSNEVWNTGFTQWHDLEAESRAAGRASDLYHFIAEKDGHATSLFSSSLSSSRTRKVVIARQAVDTNTIVDALYTYNLFGYRVDLVEIAPYFSTITDFPTAYTLYQTNPTAAVTSILDGMSSSIDYSIRLIAAHKVLADAQGVPLGLYECGQSLENSNNPEYTDMLLAVQSDPRIAIPYARYIAGFGDVLGPVNWYDDTGPWNRFGSWPHQQYTGQGNASPKWAAITGGLVPNPPPPPPPVTPPDYSGLIQQLLDLISYSSH